MAKQQDDDRDLLIDDELASAFLDDEIASTDTPVEEDEWAVDDAPGQLAVDVYETKEKLIVKARVAGVSKKDLDVSISDNTVSIRGTLASGDEVAAENYFVQECYWGEFARSIALPVPVKEEEIEAILKDGVLTVAFTKVKQDTVKKIEVM